jgi:outer membrane protein
MFAFGCLLYAHLTILVLPNMALGQADTPKTKLSLSDAMRTALKQRPILQRDEALIGAAGARVEQARSGLRPTVSLQGVATNGPLGAPAFGPLNNPGLNAVAPLGLSGMAGDPVKKQFGGGLNLAQPLFDFGRTENLVASRKDSQAATRQERETEVALVLLEVQQAYYHILRAEQLVGVAKENLRQRETTRQQAKALADAGLRPGIDEQIAAANVADARSALTAAENDLSSAFATLNHAMGETKLTEYALNPLDVPSLQTGPAKVEEAIALATKQRPELAGSHLQESAARHSLASLRSEMMPRIDGIASVGAVRPSGVITQNQNYAVGVAVTIPLYAGGLVEGRISEERQKQAAALAQEKTLRETIALQVTRAWLDLDTRFKLLVSANEQAQAAQTSVKLATERYRLGLGNLVELTDAEALSLRASANLANANFDISLARAMLDWATGETLKRNRATPR